MTKTPGKLIPKVPSPKVPSVPKVSGAVSRRAHYSATTKRALVDVAEELFTAHGYAGTSLDSIVAGARVTKGALYHHFSGKRAVFEAVFDRVEGQAGQTITKALKRQKDPWSKAMAGLESFLEVVQQPTYRRIVIQDGPSVLGYERFREQEERSTFATMTDIVSALLKAGSWDVDDGMLKTFTTIFFGAMSSAGESVATSDDTALAAARVEAAIGFLLAGLQLLAEQGVAGPMTDVDEADEAGEAASGEAESD